MITNRILKNNNPETTNLFKSYYIIQGEQISILLSNKNVG